MLLVFCLVLASWLSENDSRRCCPFGEKLIQVNGTVSCQTDQSLNYTQIFLKDFNEGDGIPFCEDNSHCLDLKNNTVFQVDCEGKSLEIPTSYPHIRLCCPYGYAYSSALHTCVDSNITAETDYFLSELTPEDLLIVDFGPLSNCGIENAIVDTPVKRHNIFLDNDITSFHIQDNPELTHGEYCFALHDDSESTIVIRSCIPREKACTSDRTCLRRCCKDGHGYYGSVRRCRPIWQPISIEIYQKYAYLEKYEPKPFGVAITNGMNCKKYPLNESDPSEKWKMLNDGSLFTEDIIIPYNEFCMENLDLDIRQGLTAFACGIDEHDAMFFITGIGMGISCIFLAATLFVYAILPRLHNLHGKTLDCHAFWLLVTYAIFTAFYFWKTESFLCVFLGFLAYFAFLSASAWLNVMCFDIWWTLGGFHMHNSSASSKRQSENQRFAFYALYATSLASILTMLAIFANYYEDIIPIEYSPRMGQDTCFIQERFYGKVIFLIIPLGIMYSVNIIFFLLTVKNLLQIRNQITKLCDTSKDKKNKKLTSDLSKFTTNGKLFVVMGIIWIFEVISIKVDPKSWIWYLPDIANALHGVFIFCIYVLKKNVIRDLKAKLLNKPLDTRDRSTITLSVKTLTSSSSTNLEEN